MPTDQPVVLEGRGRGTALPPPMQACVLAPPPFFSDAAQKGPLCVQPVDSWSRSLQRILSLQEGFGEAPFAGNRGADESQASADPASQQSGRPNGASQEQQ